MESHRRPWTAQRVGNVERGITSLPLDCTHGRQRHAWHDITAVGQHTRSDDVERGMTSPRLDSTHDQMTSGVACHHRLWTAHPVKQCQAWHAIIAFGQYTWSNNVGHGMPSSPLGSTHGRTTSGLACHHRLRAQHPVERRVAWHAIIALGQHRRSAIVGRGMPS